MGPASRVPRGPSFDLHMSYVMLSFMLCTLSSMAIDDASLNRMTGWLISDLPKTLR